MWWIVAVVAVVVLIATYVTWTASRVDRLHARAAAAQAALDSHLNRRAAAATGLADTLRSPNLREAAQAALEAYPDERELAENDLTRALRAVPRQSRGTHALDEHAFEEMVAVSRRLALSRQVHNDLVRDALAVRRRRLVRLLRLARKHPEPRYFDVDEPTMGQPTSV
jgi:hypothetical protein